MWSRSRPGVFLLLLLFLTSFHSFVLGGGSPWIDYPDTGRATMTHYGLPQGFVAACGCTGNSTNYPTAALSQMAYGSSSNYGPACGRCFNLTLLHPVIATPPFNPPVVKHIVVKITDLCPLSQDGYCSGRQGKTNSAGSFLNFDLAYPSVAIPDDFFPSDPAVYGYTDFGVWNVTYQAISCADNWAGANDPSANGAVGPLDTGVCCPADPAPDDAANFCPSFSDDNGLNPFFSANTGKRRLGPIIDSAVLLSVLTLGTTLVVLL